MHEKITKEEIMAAAANSNSIAEYNIDKARQFLTPANFGPALPNGCMDKLAIIVKNIGIFILKVFNLICGDRKWYTNDIARQIVERYFNGPQGDPVLHQKMLDLYHALELRR